MLVAWADRKATLLSEFSLFLGKTHPKVVGKRSLINAAKHRQNKLILGVGWLPVCNRDFLDFKIYRSAFERIVQAREGNSHLARRLCLFKKDRTPLEAYCVLTQRGTVRASLKPWRAA